MTKRKIVDDAPAAAPETISHPFHPGHMLNLVANDDGVEFDCNGCRQPGKGARYTCGCEHDGGCEDGGRGCDFDLHTCCALAEDVLQGHALFKKGGAAAFVLLHEPPPHDPAPRRICDACGDEVLGFVYHCFDRDLDLHPCCAQLPGQISLDGVTFELCNGKAPRRCALCPTNGGGDDGRRRRRFWSYRSVDCGGGGGGGEAVSLHVACVKNMAAHESSLKTGDHKQIVQPVNLKVAMQKRPKTSSKVKRFAKIVGILARVIIGVIFGDPTAMVVAVAGLVFNNG